MFDIMSERNNNIYNLCWFQYLWEKEGHPRSKYYSFRTPLNKAVINEFGLQQRKTRK